MRNRKKGKREREKEKEGQPGSSWTACRIASAKTPRQSSKVALLGHDPIVTRVEGTGGLIMRKPFLGLAPLALPVVALRRRIDSIPSSVQSQCASFELSDGLDGGAENSCRCRILPK